jgi:hypothetical protein
VLTVKGMRGEINGNPLNAELDAYLTLGKNAVELEAIPFLAEIEALSSGYSFFELLGRADKAEAEDEVAEPKGGHGLEFGLCMEHLAYASLIAYLLI